MAHIGDRLERSHSDFQWQQDRLPKIVVIKLQDKIKVRRLINKEPLLFHLVLKQGYNMVHFGNRNTRNHVNIK